MLRLFVVFLFGGLIGFVSPSVATPFEAAILFQFDKTRVPPATADRGQLAGKAKEVVLDGLVLWVAQPQKGKPSILFLHGSIGNLETRTWKYSWLVKQGYGLVALGYPGSSGSKGRSSSKSIMSAAHKIYAALPKLIGAGPVVVMGESLGTGPAVRLVAELDRGAPQPIGLILQAPYASVYDLVRHQAGGLAQLFRGRNDPWPSVKLIRSVKLPLFVMHGGRDKYVPHAQGKAVFKGSPAKNKLFVFRKSASHGGIFAAKGVRPELVKWMQSLK